jgi:hypothetical protein
MWRASRAPTAPGRNATRKRGPITRAPKPTHTHSNTTSAPFGANSNKSAKPTARLRNPHNTLITGDDSPTPDGEANGVWNQFPLILERNGERHSPKTVRRRIAASKCTRGRLDIIGSLSFEVRPSRRSRLDSPADEETGKSGADEDCHNCAPDLHRHDERQVDLR